MADTVYDVRVVYSVGGNASQGLARIQRQAAQATSATHGLRNALAIVGGVGLLMKGKAALIDYNSEIDQMRIGMTAVIQMQMGKPFIEANKEAEKLFNTFQELAKKSPATTKDFIDIAQQVLPAVTAARGSLKDVESLTAGAITAGTAMGFGKRLDVVAIEMKQMVQGVVAVRDQLANQLLSSEGLSASQFNKMTPQKRIAMMRKIFENPAIIKAAERQGKAYMGQMSTLKDVLQISLGKVGKPLMEAITLEAQRINEWMEKNPKTIAQFTKDFSRGLLTGFRYVKSVFEFIARNKDTLLSIAKAFMVFKGVQFAGNGLMGLAQGVTSFGGALNVATLALASFAAAASYLMDKIDGERQQVAFDVAPAVAATKGLVSSNSNRDLKHWRRVLFNQATAAGAVGKDGKFDRDIAARALTKSITLGGGGFGFNELKNDVSFWGSNALTDQGITKKDLLDTIAGMEEATMTLGRSAQDLRITNETQAQIMALASGLTGKAADARAIKPPKTQVDVTINKIEVASEDPDRFVFGLVRSFEEVVRNPTQAQAALRGGLG